MLFYQNVLCPTYNYQYLCIYYKKMLYVRDSKEEQHYLIRNQEQQIKMAKRNDFKLLLSKFFPEAISYHPYYFQYSDRENYINNKEIQQAKSESKKAKKISINFIVINRVRYFQALTENNVQETWLVDKNTLEIVRHFERYVGIKQLYQIQRSIKNGRACSQGKPKSFNKKIQNTLFFGRCDFANRSITLENPSISNKHLIMKRVNDPKNQTRSILCFLFCCKKSLSNKFSTKIMNGLSRMDSQTIRTIVNYIGYVGQNEYEIMDNCSKNGTAFYPKNFYWLSNEHKDSIVVSQSQCLGLKVINIIKMTKLSTVTAKIDSAVASSSMQNKNVRICNRNIEIQNNAKKQNENFQALLLRVITPRVHKIYILYSEQAPYILLKKKYGLTIVSQRKFYQTDDEHIGQLNYTSSKWIINYNNSQTFNFNLKNDTNYKIKNQTFLRIGKQTKIIINLKTEIEMQN